jgi:glycine dehydrogenase
MKLNATTEMIPVSWPEFSSIHPFAPLDQTKGYQQLFSELETALGIVTGFDAVSLQPNSGAQGEYAGLLCISAYFEQIGEKGRNVCLIPISSHGRIPASAAMTGDEGCYRQVQWEWEFGSGWFEGEGGETSPTAIMITYPSTYGVFESVEACQIVHANGGKVYMAGANLNAQLGLCNPAEIGADLSRMVAAELLVSAQSASRDI